MSIFTVVNVFSPGVKGGGPAQSLSHLLHSVQHEVWVFTGAHDFDGTTLNVTPDQWVNWPVNPNVKVFYSSQQGYRRLIRLFEEIFKTKPSVVWVNSFFDFRYSLLPQLAARLSARSLVVSPRGELMHGAFTIKKSKKVWFLRVFKMLNKVFTSRFHFTSEKERSESLSYLGDRDSYLFPNYSRKPLAKNDLQPYLATRTGSKRLAFLGRLVPKKGLDLAVRILAELDPDHTLEVYGEFEDPQYGDEIQTLVCKHNLTDQVVYCGFIPFEEALPQISTCQLMLAPTRGENFGHSIYECLSIGLPVVVSDQTPWKASTGVRICALNDIRAYVDAISGVEQSDPREVMEDALMQAQNYYDTLPDPAVFLKALETGAYNALSSTRFKQGAR